MTVTLKIEKNVYGGDGLGRLGDGRVCFVPAVFTGETIKAEITEQKKNFVRAKLVEILEPSKHRIDPGIVVPGMVYASVDYAEELRFKEAQLGNFLERLGQSYAHIEVVAGRSLNYRNKVTYHVERKHGTTIMGYRREFSHETVDVVSDPLACVEINSVLPEIRGAVNALLTQGAKSVRRGVARDADRLIIRHTPVDGVKWWLGNAPKNLELTEKTCGHDFKVPADGFYQVNPVVAEKLVTAVVDSYHAHADISPDVLDLYCGVGVFGICCAPNRLVGVESVHSSVSAAKRNAMVAGVKGSFFCERTGGSLNRLHISDRTMVIVDPPRGGMEKNVPSFLASSKAKRICYVSCDPATLMRDLQQLVRGYRVVSVRLFDLFPRTARFETLVELEK